MMATELPMSNPRPKHVIFEHLAEIAQALGHPNRLELLEALAQGRHSVEELAEQSGMSFANTSRHLQILRRARLVETERRGKHVLYSLAGDAEVVTLIGALGRVGERNIAEINRVMDDYFNARDTMEPVSREALAERLEAGLVILLDVRSQDEFAQGHLPGARNIPFLDLERRLGELPKEGEIVAYCRGPYCIYAVEAVSALRAQGFNALRLEGGFPEWKAAGLAVETSQPA
ncbi:ArsR/SmtB family transcription factor [Devosia honganensis]|uniref:ArsR/SmtB family transcription factor n=1 Tax=Devosia honganensis TaxID=1610527 RepID=A0ABV7X2Y5_9HYPH